VESFPNIASLAGQLTSGGPDERLAFGLDVLVAGLLARSREDDGVGR
jgi:hypothetical protein